MNELGLSGRREWRTVKWIVAVLLLLMTAAACATSISSGDTDAGACASTETICGGACADLTKDPANCSACGQICGPGLVCSESACHPACPTGEVSCRGDGGAPICTSTQTDKNNCGTCGTVCTGARKCSGGTCGSACPTGQTLCSPDAGVPHCVDTQTDNANCGSCGSACVAGLVCKSGACTLVCPTGQVACNGVCTDPQTSNQNCGASLDCQGTHAGSVCPTGSTCTAGACTPVCTAPEVACGSVCVNTMTDPNHCGNCTKMCATGQTCVGGTCLTGTCTTNIALGATPTSSGGGTAQTGYGPNDMNDGVGKVCSPGYCWVNDSTAPSNPPAYVEYQWAAPQTIGSIYVEGESTTTPLCGFAGRDIASATVQWLNGTTWVDAGAVSAMPSGNIQFNLPTQVTTTGLRIFNMTSSPGNLNSIVFEWHVYSGTSCIPPP